MTKPDKSWSLKLTRAREAMAELGGNPNWGEINVAHIDTGVTAHPCLGDWVEVERGVNYMEPGKPPIDPLNADAFNAGHGTKTASVLSGFKVGEYMGVAPKVRVVPYRVTDFVVLHSDRQRSNIAQAIRHAIDANACEVITISLGYPSMSPWHNILGEAVDYAYEHGVIVVGAGGQKVDRACYPGKFFRTIGVGGYTGDVDDERIYENYGGMINFMDIWAPADPVWRAETKPAASGTFTYDYGWGDGTSYATPHVAAAAAMWLLRHKADLIDAYGPDYWKRVEAFRDTIKRTASDISALPGLENVKPPAKGQALQPKGAYGSKNPDGPATTGSIDLFAVLQAELPDGKQFTAMPPPAAKQWG